MLKVVLSAAIAAALLSTSYLPASAHGPSIDTRQERQAAAIERGRQTGKITWTEGIKLRAQQREIKRLEAKFQKNDGRLSYRERKVLNRKLTEARRSIRAEKRDGLRRWSALPRVGK